MKRIIIILLLSMIIFNCVSFGHFFPIEKLYYPSFINGYENNIIVNILFINGRNVKFEISAGNSTMEREMNMVFQSIKIYDINNNIIADYPKEYLNKEREKVKVENELWAAYEGGLVLIPEEYHQGDRWQEYIASIKEK